MNLPHNSKDEAPIDLLADGMDDYSTSRSFNRAMMQVPHGDEETGRGVILWVLGCAVATVVMVVGIGAAFADTFGPGEMVPVSECATYAPAPLGLAPQFGPRAPVIVASAPNPQHGVIRFPPQGHGDSGGHKPEPETPAPVSLPAAGLLLIAALGGLAALRKIV